MDPIVGDEPIQSKLSEVSRLYYALQSLANGMSDLVLTYWYLVLHKLKSSVNER